MPRSINFGRGFWVQDVLFCATNTTQKKMAKTKTSIVAEMQHMYACSKQKGLTEFRIIKKSEVQTQAPKKITSSSDAAKIAKDVYEELGCLEVHEAFIALYLNRQNAVIGYAVIGTGGVSACVVDAKILYKYAIGCLASSIILVHNHPSGNLQPSQSDKELTRRLKASGEMLEISVLDHLIITGNSFYSFADEGII